MFTNESEFKYTYLSSLNTTKGFTFYQSPGCGSLNEDNIDDNIYELKQDSYGYAYPTGGYNCIVLKYTPDKNYIN